MRKRAMVILLIASLGVNIYLLGKWILIDQWYEPDAEESIILSEMVQKTVESEDYKRIAEKEKVIAINSSVDKNKGGVFPYYFGVTVLTDKQAYTFSCNNEQCTEMENSGWMYSIYQDEEQRLPFKNESDEK